MNSKVYIIVIAALVFGLAGGYLLANNLFQNQMATNDLRVRSAETALNATQAQLLAKDAQFLAQKAQLDASSAQIQALSAQIEAMSSQIQQLQVLTQSQNALIELLQTQLP
jgi:peptidoglycan hydrolase CwlO-like protein